MPRPRIGGGRGCSLILAIYSWRFHVICVIHLPFIFGTQSELPAPCPRCLLSGCDAFKHFPFFDKTSWPWKWKNGNHKRREWLGLPSLFDGAHNCPWTSIPPEDNKQRGRERAEGDFWQMPNIQTIRLPWNIEKQSWPRYMTSWQHRVSQRRRDGQERERDAANLAIWDCKWFGKLTRERFDDCIFDDVPLDLTGKSN